MSSNWIFCWKLLHKQSEFWINPIAISNAESGSTFQGLESFIQLQAGCPGFARGPEVISSRVIQISVSTSLENPVWKVWPYLLITHSQIRGSNFVKKLELVKKHARALLVNFWHWKVVLFGSLMLFLGYWHWLAGPKPLQTKFGIHWNEEL